MHECVLQCPLLTSSLSMLMMACGQLKLLSPRGGGGPLSSLDSPGVVMVVVMLYQRQRNAAASMRQLAVSERWEGERRSEREGGREGGRKSGREGGREGGRESRREGGRESRREGGRAGGREGGREGGRAGGRKSGREGEKEGGREGGRERRREGGNEKGDEGKKERSEHNGYIQLCVTQVCRTCQTGLAGFSQQGWVTVCHCRVHVFIEVRSIGG